MNVEPLAIGDVKLVTPARFGDSRGYFCEVYHQDRFAAFGIGPFVQDNQSFSAAAGTIRGLHCQVAPNVQGKLVRCIQGAIWDVAVDIRVGSASYGRYVAATLSAENGCQLWVPGGFLHGFCTTAPDTVVLYKVTAGYDRAAERAVRWDAPELGLPWPVTRGCESLSDKDREAADFAAASGWFAA